MSNLRTKERFNLNELKPKTDKTREEYQVSTYQPSDDEKDALLMVKKHFELGDRIMNKSRTEFNDLSVIERQNVDRLSFNSYQVNNGKGLEGDEINKWKSTAFRPVVRNKCISIAAHATARLVFPKVFAYDNQSNAQEDSARVMEDLMEWANDQAGYPMTQLNWTITALTDPASITYSEYSEVYRTIKTDKENGKWKEERILDETLSGFQDTIVPVNELYIENIFEPDIQKQGWLNWRKIISYSTAESKYKGVYDNFKYVSPGIQLIYNDANGSYYDVYDTEMQDYEVEEIIYWNRSLDLKLISVNGVLLTDADNPNPRLDKLYPFTKSGYELISAKFFYYKSLAFKMMGDANAINEIYPTIIDALKLDTIPPMINKGGDAITGNVIVPGAVTTFDEKDAGLEAIRVSSANAISSGMKVMAMLEESSDESSQSPTQQGQKEGGSTTAYQISRIEQNAATILGLFMQMKSDWVKQFGKLRIGDNLQYLTIAEVAEIEGGESKSTELVYKTFFLHDKQSESGTKIRKIKFDSELPSEQINGSRKMELSFETLKIQGKGEELYRVNPELFRNFKYMCGINPDIKNPQSDEIEKAMNLETYDRAINNPLADQEMVYKDFLLSTNPKSKKDPDKYVLKQPINPLQTGQPNGSPLGNIINKGKGLPQSMPAQKLQ
jgi:hypothetical protein